jgi:hypothetical protein
MISIALGQSSNGMNSDILRVKQIKLLTSLLLRPLVDLRTSLQMSH